MFPGVDVTEHRFARSTRHRAEAVTEQMNARGQGWEFIAMPVIDHKRRQDLQDFS
jgi:hypothetical protein